MENKYCQYLDELFLSELFTQKKTIAENYIHQWEKSFNIFKITNPKNFWHEDFHTNLIYSLLDPGTPDIASDNEKGIYLNFFIDLLRKKNPSVINYYFPNGYIIEQEKFIDVGDTGRTDILIHDEKKAIIIENKSNNAGDTENQLSKYYQFVIEEMGLDVMSIVYIPLDPKREPSLGFTNKYMKYKPAIEKVLVTLPIIDSNSTDDFVHGFLEKCIYFANSKENQTALFFLKQFINLLKYLGGSYMSENLDRDAILEIYTNKDKLEKCMLLVELWKKRAVIFDDVFKNTLIKNGFVDYPKYGNMHLPLDRYISLGFISANDNWMFGFTRAPEADRIPKEQEERLKTFFKNDKLLDIFTKESVIATPSWIYRKIDLGKIKNFEKIDEIVVNFNILKRLYEEII